MLWAWIVLAIAIGVEIVSTALLPKTHGFTQPWWTTVVIVGYAISIWLLAVVVEKIPLSITYAIWSGVGTAVVAVIGMTVLGEEISTIKVVSLALIVVGVVGLNVSGAH
ncbi:MAG: multidrug efflux SMR transporter [Marmoricola sp.]|jgi:multidrug transporter EmrE-like cation transporter